jgi:sugar lactone lactonase YvrE
MAVSGPVSLVSDVQAELGEGPVWDGTRQCLWFVDIKRPAVWCYDPKDSQLARVDAPEQVGWVLPARDGRLLAGLKTGLSLLDVQSGRFELLDALSGEPDHNRLNDACVAPDGRVWFGSMDDGEDKITGRFYRFDRGAVAAAGPDQVCITNGPAVCGSSSRIFFTDTLGKKIFVADLDDEGLPGPASLFADTAADFPEAYPDGPTVDAEGCVWTGLWNGRAVARYSAEGELMETVAMPVSNVTKLAFGGADLRTAFVTTARKGLGKSELEAQPLAGGLFSFRSAVAGVPTPEVELA